MSHLDKDTTTNNLYVKCVGETSWESTPSKPWFDQPFVNYPDAAKYSEVRFQDTFMKLFSLKHPVFMNIDVDNDRLVDDIKYFKRNLTPGANAPAMPFLQRGVFLSGEDLARTNIPGIFEKLYADNNSAEKEEDMFFPFAGKKIVEDKMSDVCALYVGNGAMVQSDGFDVSPEIKKQIAKEGFANNGNFWDIRLPAIFISLSFSGQEWNRFKPVSKDNPTAYIENYFLIDPINKYKLVQFNPVVFSMAFKVPYIMDAFLRENNVEEPSKEVLLNTSILYHILHGYVVNQMGNYSMDMHYNLLKKMQSEDVGYLQFRNEFIKRSANASDKITTGFDIPLLEFKNRIGAYQQFFNLVLFYLLYATNANESLRQFARPDPRFDLIFEFMHHFTHTWIEEKNVNEDHISEIEGLLGKLYRQYNERNTDNPIMSGDQFLSQLYADMTVIESNRALKIYASYNLNDKRYVLSPQDIYCFSYLLTVYYSTIESTIDKKLKDRLDALYNEGKLSYLIKYHNLKRTTQHYIADAKLFRPDYRRQLRKLYVYEARIGTPLYYFPIMDATGKTVNSFSIFSDKGAATLTPAEKTDIEKTLLVLNGYDEEVENNVTDPSLQYLLSQRNLLTQEMIQYENIGQPAGLVKDAVKRLMISLQSKESQITEYQYTVEKAITDRLANYKAMEKMINSLVNNRAFFKAI